jgi:hypothetical protein
MPVLVNSVRSRNSDLSTKPWLATSMTTPTPPFWPCSIQLLNRALLPLSQVSVRPRLSTMIHPVPMPNSRKKARDRLERGQALSCSRELRTKEAVNVLVEARRPPAGAAVSPTHACMERKAIGSPSTRGPRSSTHVGVENPEPGRPVPVATAGGLCHGVAQCHGGRVGE